MDSERQTQEQDATTGALTPDSFGDVLFPKDAPDSFGGVLLAKDRTMHKANLERQLRKTRLCVHWMAGGCQFGEKCTFAHGRGEIQRAPDLRRTKLCRAFMNGGCTDPKCSFAHGDQELRWTEPFYKKTLCLWHAKGRCNNGERCRFAHGPSEIRCPSPTRKADFVVKAAVPGTGGTAPERSRFSLNKDDVDINVSPCPDKQAYSRPLRDLMLEPMVVNPASKIEVALPLPAFASTTNMGPAGEPFDLAELHAKENLLAAPGLPAYQHAQAKLEQVLSMYASQLEMRSVVAANTRLAASVEDAFTSQMAMHQLTPQLCFQHENDIQQLRNTIFSLTEELHTLQRSFYDVREPTARWF